MTTPAHQGNTKTAAYLTPQQLRQSFNAQMMNIEALANKCLNDAATPEERARIKAEIIRQSVRLSSRLCDA